jgi:hypothetical protein
MRYLLDKNIHIAIEKDAEFSSDPFKAFMNMNVEQSMPRALYDELLQTDYAVVAKIPSKVTPDKLPLIFTYDQDVKSFSYQIEKDVGCKTITGLPTVEAPDVESILHCIKKGNIFVTEDGGARQLAEAFGIKVRSFNEFKDEVKYWITKHNYYI